MNASFLTMAVSNWAEENRRRRISLFRYLEFSALDDLAILVAKLENIYPTEVFRKVYSCFGRDIREVKDFLTQETVDLERIVLVVTFYKIKTDLGNCRVRIEAENTCRGFLTGC